MSCRKFIVILTISTVFALHLFPYVNGAAANITATTEESVQIQKISILILQEKYEEAREILWKFSDPARGIRLVTQKNFKDDFFEKTLSFFQIADKPETPCKLYAAGMGMVLDETLALGSSASSDDNWFTRPTRKAQLVHYAQRWQKDCGNVTQDPDVASITNRSKIEVDKVIKYWAEGIRNGTDYVRVTSDQVDVAEYLTRIVHSSYADNSSNLVYVAQFVDRDEELYARAVGWTQLLKALQEDKNVEPISKPMMLFSHYFLKDAADKRRYHAFTIHARGKEAEEMYVQINEHIPDVFNTMLPVSSCVLWNVARNESLQVDKNSQGKGKLMMRPRSESEEGKWHLKPFIAKRYETGEGIVAGGKLRFAVEYSKVTEDSRGQLCVETEMVKTGWFGLGKKKETGSSGLCSDTNFTTETTRTWQLEPVVRGNETLFRMVTGNQDGPNYVLYAKENNEVDVTQVKGNERKDGSEYYWRLDCNSTRQFSF